MIAWTFLLDDFLKEVVSGRKMIIYRRKIVDSGTN